MWSMRQRNRIWLDAVVSDVWRAVSVVSISLSLSACSSLDAAPQSSTVPTSTETAVPTRGLALDSMAMFGDDGWGVTYETAGAVANLLRSSDGGHTWRRVTPQIAQGNFIFGFALIDSSHAWLMAALANDGSGTVDLWATPDGGRSWSMTTAPGIAFRGALITFSDSTHGWLATPGEPGSQYEQQGIVIDHTTDGGQTWQMVTRTNLSPGTSTVGAPSVNCGKNYLSFLNDSIGWLTGGCTAGITFDLTTDGGVTWTAQALASPDGATFSSDCAGGSCTLSAPRFLSTGYGYMVLHTTGSYPGRSWVYTSMDGGNSWTSHALPGQETRVSMVSTSVGFASVGPAEPTAGWFYRTDDGGLSWQPVRANFQLTYVTLDCVTGSRCWALSPTLTGPTSPTDLYETTDGGKTWSLL